MPCEFSDKSNTVQGELNSCKIILFMSSLLIKTHDSESPGQEAAIICETKIMQPLSELFTRKTAKKITNALAKLP